MCQLLTLKSANVENKCSDNVYFLGQATPRLSEDKVKQCVDPKLKGEYPPKGVAKVYFPTVLI